MIILFIWFWFKYPLDTQFVLKTTLFLFLFFNTLEDKETDKEQSEELPSDLADVASQAEDSIPNPASKEKEPTLNEESLKEDIFTESQQTVPQSCPSRTYSGRGRPPKTALVSHHKKSLIKEKVNAARDAPRFKDDTSDTDYTPSGSLFTKSPFGTCCMMYNRNS